MKASALRFLVVCLVGLASSCGREAAYKVDYIIREPSLKNCGKDLTAEIQSSAAFSENLINAYQKVVNQEVNPEFKGSFLFASGKGISVKAVFSSVSECFVYLYPDQKKSLTAACTTYPVQLSILLGIDSTYNADSNVRSTVPYTETLDWYKRLPVMFAVKNTSFFSRLSFEISDPKIFDLSDQSLVVLQNVSTVVANREGEHIQKTFEHVGVLTGAHDFSFALEIASQIGQSLAKKEIEQQVMASLFFKTVLAHDKLKPSAEQIQQKISHAQKDPSFEYPLWQFKKDLAELYGNAHTLGLDDDYADDLLKDLAPQRDGYLLWYYPNHRRFMEQWALVNFCLLLLLVLSLRFKKPLVRRLPSFLGRRLAFLAVVIVINAWIFHERPSSLELKYWLLPGALFLTDMLIALLAEEKVLGKNSA